MTRVLVTGATGFIGRSSLAPLLASGADVHAVSTRPAPLWSPVGVTWHREDLMAEAATRLLREVRPQQLLHFAWNAEPGSFWASEDNVRWVEASLRLLRAFASVGGRRAVLAGTCAEYAWGDRTHCVEDATPLEPASLYGAAKHALHLLADAHAQKHGYALPWGRIFFVFGPREDRRRLCGSIASALATGQSVQSTHGRQVHDFLYAPDLAEAFVALLASDVVGAVNVASGQPLALRELITALEAAAGRPGFVETGARSPGAIEPASLTADVSRLHNEVGWRPRHSLDEAARATVGWWASEAAGQGLGRR